MEKFLLLMVMFATCCGAPQDLSGKVFVFPAETTESYVKLLRSTTNQMSAVTLCLRFLTDLTRNYSLFSSATRAQDNHFLLFKPSSEHVIKMHVQDGAADFLSLSFPPNTWHSLCATWSSDTGLAQLWVDGKRTIKRFIKSGQPISGEAFTIMGQEQDSYGGDFDVTQTFVGMISKVHMWNYILSTAEIKRYVDDTIFTPGNIYNWRALEYEIKGQVLVDEKPEDAYSSIN
ncbi:C-reactive protein-like [Mugil cephalus]|uniref:C-reactive protein-like n=1 Tax=Mugil cephalus TaxID=48193 RepID=UPI001FB68808|nr:C-reactive protein-like [Mugil cephalus]